MSDDLPPRKRQFRCSECQGLIVIPWNLPPTKAPCPHCGKTIESPAPPAPAGPVARSPAAAVVAAVPAPAPAPAAVPVPSAAPAPEVSSAAIPARVPAPAVEGSRLAAMPMPVSMPLPAPPTVVPIPPPPAAPPAPLPAAVAAPAAPPAAPVEAAVPALESRPVAAPPPPDPEPPVAVVEPVAAVVPPPAVAAEVGLAGAAVPAGPPAVDERPVPPVVERTEVDLVPAVPERRRGGRPAKARSGPGQLVAVLVAVLLVVGALAAAYWVAKSNLNLGGMNAPAPVDETREAEIRRARYLRVGWRDDARVALESFLAATTVEEKARWSIGGESLIPEMREFYGGARIDDSDTPAANFSHFDLRLEDRERGMFLMIYDLPPQFQLGEFFRPLAPLEVQYGLEGPDMLLASFARASNFVQEPVRVQAFFKQGADGAMKVDWHLFVQTKHRLFRAFQSAAEPGRRGVFRLLVGEDVPEAGRTETGTRTYRLDDPIHAADSVRVRVPVDSEVGRILSAVNWRDDGGQRPETKTATLELAWQGGDSPELVISRFFCWEFLGLGGSGQ